MAALEKFSDFIEVPLKCFEVLGMKPYDKSPSSRTKKLFRAYFYFSHALVTISASFFMVYFVQICGDIQKVSESVPLWGYTLLAFAKSLSIFKNRKRFEQIIETLEELFPKTKEDQEIANVQKYLKGYKKVELCLAVPLVFAVLMLIVTSLMRSTIFWRTDEISPFNNWYPFDAYQPVVYNLVLIWEVVEVVTSAFNFLGSDLIFCSLITLLSMQFDILCLKLQQLTSKDDVAKIKQLMELHKKIINLTQLLEEIFSPTILLNFTMSSMLICLFGYGLSIASNLELFVQSALMVCICSLQVLFICDYGNKLTNAADNVGTSVYNCDWLDNYNRELKPIMLMIIQRSQRSTVLTAMKFSVLNLEAFTTVKVEGSWKSLGLNCDIHRFWALLIHTS
jgi:gustatory receptor